MYKHSDTCSANQMPRFYMIATLAFNELREHIFEKGCFVTKQKYVKMNLI